MRVVTAWICLLSLVLCGCGSNSSSSETATRSASPVAVVLPGASPTASPPSLPSPTPQTATVSLQFQLLRGVPLIAQSLVITGTDDAGNVLYGPLTFARQASITLVDVPVSVTHIHISYQFQNTVLATADVVVQLTPGASVSINDPDFTVVSQPTGISFSPANVSLSPGASVQVQATLSFSDNKTYPVTSAQWSSSDSGVATVSPTGLVGGASSGTATVSAQFLGVTGNLSVKVANPTPGLLVVPASAGLSPLASMPFGALLQSNGSTQNVTSQVTWISGNPLVALVSANGTVTGVGGGTTNIVANFQGITGSSPVTVSGAPLTALSLAPQNYLLVPLQTLQMVAQGSYSDGTTRDLSGLVSWVASSPVTVGVTPTGFATGLFVGDGNITASIGPLLALSQGEVRLASFPAPPFVPPGPTSSPSPSPHGILYVSDNGSSFSFKPATANGDVAPNTQIPANGGALYADPTTNTLWSSNNFQVQAFQPASTLNGAATPVVRFTTPERVDTGIYYDQPRDRVYVIGGRDVLIYDNASTLTGTPPVNVTLTLNQSGPATQSPGGITYDPVRDRLYVSVFFNQSTSASEVLEYDNASTFTGNGVTLVGSTVQTNVCNQSLTTGAQQMTLSPDGSRLYVADGGQVVVYANPNNSNTAVAVVGMTDAISGVALDPGTDELYGSFTTSEGTGEIRAFSGASLLTGTPSPTPVRTIGGVTAGLVSPGDLSLDLTR